MGPLGLEREAEAGAQDSTYRCATPTVPWVAKSGSGQQIRDVVITALGSKKLPATAALGAGDRCLGVNLLYLGMYRRKRVAVQSANETFQVLIPVCLGPRNLQYILRGVQVGSGYLATKPGNSSQCSRDMW